MLHLYYQSFTTNGFTVVELCVYCGETIVILPTLWFYPKSKSNKTGVVTRIVLVTLVLWWILD